MMNRHQSTDPCVPPFLPFSPLPPNTTTTTTWVPTSSPFLDPPPALLPIPTLPFPATAGFQVKAEEEQHNGGLIVPESIGLNLGHRTYFPSSDSSTIDQMFARSRGILGGVVHQSPQCQAEGCNADLSGSKHYHRRHKVCEFHSKATVVVAGGLQQRFCQQCSRFHVLSEFDEAKRSCRKRLADHNRRRRKPQPQIQLDSCFKPKSTTIKTSQAMIGANGSTSMRNGPGLSLGVDMLGLQRSNSIFFSSFSEDSSHGSENQQQHGMLEMDFM